MDWAQILVFLLAILFTIFLIIAIVLAVLLLRMTRQIRSAAKSAERTIHTLEDSVNTFHKTAVPLAVTKAVLGQLRKRADKKAREDESKRDH